MPRARCRYYDDAGVPLRGGCRKIGTCQFVHPSDPAWATAPKSQATLQGSRKRREPDSGHSESDYNGGANTWTKISKQGDSFLTGANCFGSTSAGWGNRSSGNVGKDSVKSSSNDTWGKATWDDSSAGDAGQGKGKEKDWGWGSSNDWEVSSNKAGESLPSSTKGWEPPIERSGSPGWGNSAYSWDSWGNSASGWGDTGPSDTASNTTTTAASKSKKSSDPWGTRTTSSSTRSRTNDNRTGGSSWGNDDFVTRDVSPAPAQAPVSAPARDPSPPAERALEEPYESPRANIFEDSAMDVDISEPQAEQQPLASPPPVAAPIPKTLDSSPKPLKDRKLEQAEQQSLASPPPVAAHISKTPPIEDSSPNSLKDRKRSRSCSPEVQKTFTRSDYVKALIESAVCQHQYDQAHSTYEKHKSLQHSKAYTNVGPLAIKTLTQQGDEYAERLEEAQKRRSKAAKRLVAIAGYYHDCSPLPLDWEHAADADPVEFVGNSIEEVKAWVNKALDLLQVHSELDDTDVGRVHGSSSDVLPAATSTAVHELSRRLSILEQQVEDQYLMQIQAGDERTSDDSAQDETEPMSSAHTNLRGYLRNWRERKAQVDASLKQVQKDVIPILSAHQNHQEELKQVREEQQALSARMATLEQDYLINQAELRGNKAEIDRLFSHIREADEARKRALDPVDPAVLVEQLRPAVLHVVHEEMHKMSSAVTNGLVESLTMIRKQTVELVWAQVGPVAKLAATFMRNLAE